MSETISPTLVKVICWFVFLASIYSLSSFFSDYRTAQQLDAAPRCTDSGPSDCITEIKVTVLSVWIQKTKHVTFKLPDGSTEVVYFPDQVLGLVPGQQVSEAYWRGKVVYFKNKFGYKTITVFNPRESLYQRAVFGSLGTLLAGLKIWLDLRKSL